MDEEAQAIAARLVRRLKGVGATITVAESCTGGLLASTLTDIAGASDWFERSWVCYSNRSKNEELDVEAELLKQKGAVNAAVAIEMAEGARKRADADLGISITGIAGPKSDDSNKPVGLVYVGIASRHWANAESVQMGGDRHDNKVAFVHFALQTAIDCWDNAKIRKSDAMAKQAEEKAAEIVKTAKSDAAKAQKAADAAAGSPWQDESWQGKGNTVGDDDSIEWKN
ncbi:MAG: hypothetical protein CXT71_05575 [Methanobacteriota archaeon]|jgi:PncC family amidohydrolase|nr:MAG: hypothetical protein CXT71_05575 [Euryarchaeota archaeon]HIL66076.1 CinA family protein [Candidatus Poseidoniales archaeon]